MSTLALSQFDLNQIIIEETRRLLEEKSFIKRSTRSVVSEISDQQLDAYRASTPGGSGVGGEIFMDLVQLTLSTVGIFGEGPGALADLANAGISAARGFCFEALLDLTAAIPAFGVATGVLSASLKATKIGAKNVTRWSTAGMTVLRLMKEYFRTIFRSKEVLKETSEQIFEIIKLDMRVAKASQSISTKTDKFFTAKLRKFVENSEETKSAIKQAVKKKRAELKKAKDASGDFQKPGGPPVTVPEEEIEKIRQEIVKKSMEAYKGDDLTQEQLKTLQGLRQEAFNEAKASEPLIRNLNPFRAMNERELKEALDDFFRVQGFDPKAVKTSETPAGLLREVTTRLIGVARFLKKFGLFIERAYPAIEAFLDASENIFSSVNDFFEAFNDAFCEFFKLNFDEGMQIINKYREGTSEPEGSQGEGGEPQTGTPAQTPQTGTGDSKEDPQPTGITRQKSFGG
tara:strand:+ start:400 stop:1773 length:1374 start_codon:yes stop_codon:yes gene_type:complete